MLIVLVNGSFLCFSMNALISALSFINCFVLTVMIFVLFLLEIISNHIIMYYNSRFFNKFCKERNIRGSTVNSYLSSVKKYENFHNMKIDDLLNEAIDEERDMVPLKDRRVKRRLLNYRTYLLGSGLSQNTVKSYFVKVKTFYQHFEVELPNLPEAKYRKDYETNYLDLPSKEHIRMALDISTLDLQSVILFMSSSGTAKAETLSLRVNDFVNATREYHDNGSLNEILDQLNKKDNVIPTFYLKRIKTDKYYYTFCSSEATSYIVRYLLTRQNLKLDDKLFDFTYSTLLARFQEINDYYNWGFKGKYRFFRSHTLRKFHASNIGLSAEYIDSLQGRSKNEVHSTYIKTNPQKLKEIYTSVMENIMINSKDSSNVTQEFTIVINVFLSGKEYNIY